MVEMSHVSLFSYWFYFVSSSIIVAITNILVSFKSLECPLLNKKSPINFGCLIKKLRQKESAYVGGGAGGGSAGGGSAHRVVHKNVEIWSTLKLRISESICAS